MLTAAEVVEMLADTAGTRLADVQYDGSSTQGHLETVDSAMLAGGLGRGEVNVPVQTVVIATGSLPDLEIDADITVNGTLHTIADHGRERGMLTRIVLGPACPTD